MQAIFLLFVLCLSCINALSFVSNALGSNMVLQRAPERASLWGWSKTVGANITVKFNGNLYHAKARTEGSWLISLDPTDAGGPYTIQVLSSAGESATLTNVLFGDVWVCGGQSNMQFTVDSAFNATEELKKAGNYPNIRVFTVGQGTVSTTPLNEFGSIKQPWSLASSASIGVGNWSAFSAVCWFFGRDLYDRYHVPIGLVSNNWGGTYIQTWSSTEALRACGVTPEEEEAVQMPESPQADPNKPSLLWNAMIVPVLPMRILGVTWYQGENNAYDPDYYACGFPEMIKDWRIKWGIDFGFYYVQLAPWLNNDVGPEPLTRLAQLYANSLPKVGFATAMDLGDPTSPFGSIHPRDKQLVGLRLSAAARAITYGEKVSYLGPIASDWKILSETGNAAVEVSFEPASIASGMEWKQFFCPDGVPNAQCASFQLGTTNGWLPPDTIGLIKETTVRVAATIGTAKVTGVRYGFGNYPLAVLWSKDGFPGIPFYFPNPLKPPKLN